MDDHVCAVHPDREAMETCTRCHRPFCDACISWVGMTRACTECAARLKRRREYLGVGAVGVLVLGIVAAVFFSARGGPSGSIEPPAVTAMRKKLAAAPCDQDLVAKLADKLNQLGRFKETLKTGKAWHKRCGAYGFLDWKLFYAAKELGQWKEAISLADGLVKGDPRDSDFWWWRGEVRARIGDNGAALADYRQSIANSDNADAAGFAVGRIVAPARTGHEPCEAADAIQYFVHDLGGQIALDLRDDMVSFARQGHCLTGARGAGAFAVSDALHPAVVDAVVGGTKGHFHVDSATGTTVVTVAFAKRAGIKAGADAAQTMAEGQPRTGSLATTSVALGGAHADHVDVLVVDHLGAKVDGVIGLDFLWQFQRTARDDRVELTVRK